MLERNYRQIAEIEKKNWFFKSKRDLIQSILRQHNIHPKKSLDIGAGIGANIGVLERFSGEVHGVESSETAIKLAREKGISTIYHGDALTFNKSRYDFILCSDILEHVDDEKLMENLSRLIDKNGSILITVPAFWSLWGYSDIIAHHRRRYSMKSFRKLIKKHGFKIIFINYWNFLMFVPAITYIYLFERCLLKLLNKKPRGNLSVVPRWLNVSLFRLIRLENRACMKIPLPFGVDIVALIKKT